MAPELEPVEDLGGVLGCAQLPHAVRHRGREHQRLRIHPARTEVHGLRERGVELIVGEHQGRLAGVSVLAGGSLTPVASRVFVLVLGRGIVGSDAAKRVGSVGGSCDRITCAVKSWARSAMVS